MTARSVPIHNVVSQHLHDTALGRPASTRASHVEPDAEGQWWADLSPVEGPSLGPYPRRTEALGAEHNWLEANWLAGSAG